MSAERFVGRKAQRLAPIVYVSAELHECARIAKAEPDDAWSPPIGKHTGSGYVDVKGRVLPHQLMERRLNPRDAIVLDFTKEEQRHVQLVLGDPTYAARRGSHPLDTARELTATVVAGINREKEPHRSDRVQSPRA